MAEEGCFRFFRRRFSPYFVPSKLDLQLEGANITLMARVYNPHWPLNLVLITNFIFLLIYIGNMLMF